MERKTLEPQAIALYKQGKTFPQIEAQLRKQHGPAAFKAATYRAWAKTNPEWRRSAPCTPNPDPGDISVDADIARLRQLRRRTRAILDQVEAIDNAEANELKLLTKLEEDLAHKIDPDGLLDWTERFLNYTAEQANRDDADRVAAAAEKFAEHVFGLIKAAVLRRPVHNTPRATPNAGPEPSA